MEIDNVMSNFSLDRDKEKLNPEEIEFLNTLSNDEVNQIIALCDNKYNYHNALQNGQKLALNSLYGAMGNPFFVCSNVDIAGAITIMGRNIIKLADKVNESYWYDYWHLDEDLHNHLGIDKSKIKPLDARYLHRESGTFYVPDVIKQEEVELGVYQRVTPVSAYVDTDSLFLNFSHVIEQLEIPENEQLHFIQKICKFRLEPLFEKKLNSYAKKYGVKNLQVFELENINESVIFLNKKMYIKHTSWEEGVLYKRLEKIIPKGVDLIKKGTPKFARDNVMKIILYLFENSTTYNIKELLNFVKDLKKQFELTDINDIVKSTNVNNYYSRKINVNGKLIDSPGVLNDKDDLLFALGSTAATKAAGLYNYLLNQNHDLQSTYEFIKPGTKVKTYPCIHDKHNRFCYVYGSYPKEFAPPVDYDELFKKTVIDQVNMYIKALGLPELNRRLNIVMSLF